MQPGFLGYPADSIEMPFKSEREMNVLHRSKLLSGLSVAAICLCFSGTASAVDAAAAQTLARQSACFNCHAVDKQKVGPAWHDVAVKYKGNPEAEEKIVKQLTTGKVQLNDGKTGEHATAKTKDPEAVKNLASWILSL